MIKSLELKNIQSHENTRLEFHKGINAIIGSSNNGKSAILRGLYWVKNNRPLGIDTLNSHWNFDDKSNIKNEMSVTLENDYGTITRKRTKTENQYIVNGKVLNVVKTDIPDDVINCLHLSDTNVQKQLDAPFLLSESSGEVAKYFNKIVRLDIIDKVLSNAESSRRKTNQEIERTEKEITELENKVKSFDWLDDVEKLLDKYNSELKKNNELNNKFSELQTDIDNYNEHSKNIYDFTAEKKIIEKIENEISIINKLQKAREQLFDEIEYITSNKVYDFGKEKRLIEKLEFYFDKIEGLKDKIYSLKNDCEKMAILENSIKENTEQIEELKNELPDVCPICGNIMKNGICVEEEK